MQLPRFNFQFFFVVLESSLSLIFQTFKQMEKVIILNNRIFPQSKYKHGLVLQQRGTMYEEAKSRIIDYVVLLCSMIRDNSNVVRYICANQVLLFRR